MYFSKRGFTLIELLVVIAIIGILASIVLTALNGARGKGRDANRIAEIKQIRYALELYYGKFNQYPQCLSAGGGCTTSLDTSGFLPKIPTDPSTGIGYSYAGTGSPSNCSGYHLGIAIEDKTNIALQTDADALGTAPICTGSAANFYGTSYPAAGAACTNLSDGVAQPTGNVKGETCYDVTQ
jgi:prepilin-type N-terminal cleavage/methylation domain-containing protein